MKGTPRELFDQQMQLIAAGDLEGLMQQYSEDAVLVRFDRTARGREEIRALMSSYLAQSPSVQTVDALASTDDTLSYQATMVIGGTLVRTYGVWVVREGTIWRQAAGLLSA